MAKTIVLNFANHVGNYAKMQLRLKQSLERVGYTGDIKLFNHEEQIDLQCPYHKSEDMALHAAGRVVPYAFKAFAIKWAMEQGYENIIWMDSAIYATKDITPFISHIENNGYAFFDNIGFTVGDYTSDACLRKHNWTREKAFNAKMIMACLMGINTKSKPAMNFFLRYFEAAIDGVSYLGAWNNHNGEVSEDLRVKGHRHDQSIASIIIHDMELSVLNAQQTYFAYTSHKGILDIAPSVSMWSEGL